MNKRKLISGRFVELSGGRIVCVAKLEPEGVGLGFRNENGEVTKISLSFDAAAALGELLTNPISGTHTNDPSFPISTNDGVYRWTVVAEMEVKV